MACFHAILNAIIHASTPRHSITEVEDENHNLLGSEALSTEPRVPHRKRCQAQRARLLVISWVNAFMFSVSLVVIFTWLYRMHVLTNPLLRQLSSYTPIMDRINLSMQTKLINGTLYPSKHPSIARQMPNDEADLVWGEWEIGRIIPVTARDIRKMGKDPSTVAKLEHEIYGLGDDAYATIFDVYHQLHCLNSLRKLIYKDDYPKTHNWPNQYMHHIHINHCVDVLMQAIQCSGNLNLITMHWVETEPWPYPDMSINRKCIDFDQLTEWRLQNSVDLETYAMNSFKNQTPGVKVLPGPDGFYKYFNPNNLTNPNHINGANPGEDFNL